MVTRRHTLLRLKSLAALCTNTSVENVKKEFLCVSGMKKQVPYASIDSQVVDSWLESKRGSLCGCMQKDSVYAGLTGESSVRDAISKGDGRAFDIYRRMVADLSDWFAFYPSGEF